MKKNNAKKEPSDPTLAIILANIILVTGGMVLWIFKEQVWLPCVPANIGIILSGVIGAIILHIAWRFLLSPLFSTVIPATPIIIFKIMVKPRALIKYLNNINLKGLSNHGLLVLGLITLFIIFGLFLFPGYLFTVAEDPPIIQEFSVEYLPSGTKKSYHPGDTIQAKDQILVEAKIIGACTSPCKWSSSKGSLLPGKACSVLYTSSVAGGLDNLTVIVQSPCKTIQTTSTMLITQ